FLSGMLVFSFFFSSRRRHTRFSRDWSSDVCSSDLITISAQMVSYEIAMGFCFLVVIMVSGSMNLTEIVMGQGQGTMAAMGLGFRSEERRVGKECRCGGPGSRRSKSAEGG